MATAYLVFAGACGGSAKAAVSPATVAAVEHAEEREGHRRYDEARTLYEAAERDAPDDRSRAWAARQYASALISWGEDAAAERALERVTVLDPTEPSAWHDLGVLRARRGDTAGAETALRSAIERAPRDARPRIALAALLVNARRFEEALAEYDRILGLELPDRTREAVHRGMAMIRAELKQ